MQHVLDAKIDYRRLYEKYLKKAKIQGSELTGLCPFHNDKKASFGVDLKNGKYKCLACGAQGNATTFLAELNHISNAEAYKMLLKEAGVFEERKSTKRANYTIEEYAKEKMLPVDFLSEIGVKNGRVGISIEYYDENGTLISKRQRYGKSSSGPRFTWTKGSKVNLYGLWKLAAIRKAGVVALVEGESDSQTIWHHGFEALGVPGASTFKKEWVELLKGVDIYIHKEPDLGGDTFLKKICDAFAEAKADNNIFQFTVPGAKDPSALHCKSPDDFVCAYTGAMNGAQKIDINDYGVKIEEIFPGAPVCLKQPAGWQMGEFGIKRINDKTGLPELVCRTPVLLSRRLKSIDTGEEKVEIAFFRDHKWITCPMPRSTVFQSKSIVQLSDLGVTVTSENAKGLVKFLGDLEAENIDVMQKAKSVARMGWYDKNFLPGHEGELVLDVDPSAHKWVTAYEVEGECETWAQNMEPFRENNIFRFILAGSFAAPLLKLLNHRIFFIHNWGDSRAGKTAALKAALSVWGDPEQLMTSFNATKVGLERLAGFFNDLPLGIDERQVAGNKQDYIDTMVYMLSMGTGRVRGAKHGGLQAQNQWRTIVLTTGEEPLTSESSQSGVYTRALQIFGSPFLAEGCAGAMHDLSCECYGVAGPKFIELIKSLKVEDLRDRFKKIKEELTAAWPNKLGSHISSVAIVTLADELISSLFWDELEGQGSREMADFILENIGEAEDMDVNSQAWEYITSWVAANEMQFLEHARAPRFGYKANGDWYVYPHIFRKALDEAGYSYRKTTRAFMDMEKIGYSLRNGKKTSTVVKWFDNTSSRFIKINRLKAEEETPPF